MKSLDAGGAFYRGKSQIVFKTKVNRTQAGMLSCILYPFLNAALGAPQGISVREKRQVDA